MNTPLSLAALRRVVIPSTDRDENLANASHRPSSFDALKLAVRRKRKRPTSLTPLDAAPSPQHTHRATDETDRPDDVTFPQRPASPLPPLVVNVLERKRLFLNAQGEPVVGVEELLQLQELSLPSPVRASPLQLIAVPRRVFDDDEVALMPCHSLHYRMVPSLDVEKWKEPLRDRDKHWRDDELAMILTHTRGAAAETKMTRGPANVRKGTWRKLDSKRLQLKAAASTSTIERDVSQPNEVLLRVQGGMISKTYCVVTIYGIGIYGRLYSEGLADRNGASRFLRIEAYDPATSYTAPLKVSLADLEWVLEAHPDLLAPGHKHSVLRKVVSLLYFQYPEDTETEGTSETKRYPILCISPDEKLTDAARRRHERDERLRREEEERLRRLAALLALPRRARHRVAIQLCRVSGHAFVVSIYHFPSHVRNFLVVAYHPRTARTLTLSVSVREAALLRRVLAPPHTWTREQTTAVAAALIPSLRLQGAKDFDETYRVALAMDDDRRGAQGEWLALTPPVDPDARKAEIVAKYTKDGRMELQLTPERQLAELETTAATTATTLRTDIATAEAKIITLATRDTELYDRIEEINSGHGLTDDKQQQHEQRRGFKAERKAIKDEKKALESRISAWKHELNVLNERALVEKEKLQIGHAKAVETLTQRAETATLSLWFDPLRDRKAPLRQSQTGGNRQRHRRLRGEIHADGVVVASGACVLSERRVRFSVVAELSLPVAADGDDDTVASNALEWFRLVFYDAVASRSRSLRLTRLEWLALTKTEHDAALAIAAFGISTSSVVQQLAALDAAYETTRHTFATLPPLKKHDKKRRQLRSELTTNRHERRKLGQNDAAWTRVVRALCSRVQIAETDDLVLDQCLYRATLGLVSVVEGNDNDNDAVVDCEVAVSQCADVVTFEARDLATNDVWTLAYPDSVELVKEFAVETKLELELHLEAIATTLLLFTNGTDARQMRFED